MKCAECGKEFPKEELVFNDIVEDFVCKKCDEELHEQEEEEQWRDEAEEEVW